MPLKFIPPQTPTLADKPPEGEGWIHEVKYDGYRTQLIVENGKARAFTKNGHDWSDRYAPIIEAAAVLPCESAIIDGEMVVLDSKGAADFNALASAIRWEPERLVFVAFDLLWIDGIDYRGNSLIDRRNRLWELVKPAEGRIQFSHHIEAEGQAFFKAVDDMELEGIVSKKANSRYFSGPSKSWLKIKCFTESDFEVIGVMRQPGEAPMALMASPGQRKYVGRAIVALKGEMRERLWKRVRSRTGPPPKGIKKQGAEMVKPGLIGRVRYLKGELKLRHATLTEIKEPPE